MSRNPFWISKRGIAVDAGIILYGIIICLASIQDSVLLWVLSIISSIAMITLLRLPKNETVSTQPHNDPGHGPHQSPNAMRSNLSKPAPAPNQSVNPKVERSLPAVLNPDTEIDVDAMDWFNDWGRRHQGKVTSAEKTLDF